MLCCDQCSEVLHYTNLHRLFIPVPVIQYKELNDEISLFEARSRRRMRWHGARSCTLYNERNRRKNREKSWVCSRRAAAATTTTMLTIMVVVVNRKTRRQTTWFCLLLCSYICFVIAPVHNIRLDMKNGWSRNNLLRLFRSKIAGTNAGLRGADTKWMRLLFLFCLVYCHWYSIACKFSSISKTIMWQRVTWMMMKTTMMISKENNWRQLAYWPSGNLTATNLNVEWRERLKNHTIWANHCDWSQLAQKFSNEVRWSINFLVKFNSWTNQRFWGNQNPCKWNGMLWEALLLHFLGAMTMYHGYQTWMNVDEQMKITFCNTIALKTKSTIRFYVSRYVRWFSLTLLFANGIYDRRWMTSKLVPLGDTLHDVQWHSVPHGAVVLPRVAID